MDNILVINHDRHALCFPNVDIKGYIKSQFIILCRHNSKSRKYSNSDSFPYSSVKVVCILGSILFVSW